MGFRSMFGTKWDEGKRKEIARMRDKKFSMREISKHTGVPCSTVHQILKEMGYKPMTRGRKKSEILATSIYKREARNCKYCEKPFASTGKHHRYCGTCRSQVLNMAE